MYSLDDDEETGIEVSLGFFPLAWILYFCTPTVEIEGRPKSRPWGTHFFPLEPGRYEVKIYFAYLFMSQCGLNSAEVRVRPGEVAHVSFYMWPLMFLPGSLTVRD